MRRALTLAVALLALAIALLPAAALGATARPTLNDVENQLMCDTCNVPLNVAVSARADQERQEISTLIAQGMTKQQIIDRFEQEYGPRVLAVPRGGGASITVWAIPAGAVAVVIIGLLLLLPRWRRRRPADAPDADAAPAVSTADERRLEQDLAAYDL